MLHGLPRKKYGFPTYLSGSFISVLSIVTKVVVFIYMRNCEYLSKYRKFSIYDDQQYLIFSQLSWYFQTLVFITLFSLRNKWSWRWWWWWAVLLVSLWTQTFQTVQANNIACDYCQTRRRRSRTSKVFQLSGLYMAQSHTGWWTFALEVLVSASKTIRDSVQPAPQVSTLSLHFSA